MDNVAEENTTIDAKGTDQNILVWSDECSVNIKEMDEQHKKLVEIINKHNTAEKSKELRQRVKSTIKELLDYIDVHFKREEELMMQHDYSEYKAHKEEHSYIADEVYDLYMKHMKGEENVAFMVTSLMKHWLFNHICIEDKKYSKYLNSKGVK